MNSSVKIQYLVEGHEVSSIECDAEKLIGGATDRKIALMFRKLCDAVLANSHQDGDTMHINPVHLKV